MNFLPATHPENESQSGRRFRVAVSVCGIIRKLRPSLSRYSGTGFPPRSLLGKRVPPCAAATFSLRPRPAQSSILRGTGLASTGWDRGLDAGSTSHLYRVEALRGESAYLLRKYAPASAACRRPRPLATNASRLLNARALHRVRFSAERTDNKMAGRYTYLPACYIWWRRGESNSGPRKPPDWHLQAQSLVFSRMLCAQRHARGVLTGSVLAYAIPITCAGAFP